MEEDRREEKAIQITLVKSGIHRLESQRRTLRALGLTRMHKTVCRKDDPMIRGMIRKVAHLVTVVEGKDRGR